MNAIRVAVATLALTLASDRAVVAQLAPVDYFLAGSLGAAPHCYGVSALYRVTPTGVVTTLQSLAGRAGCLTQSQPVVDPTTNTMVSGHIAALYRFDTTTNALLTQRWMPNVSGTTRHHAFGITCVNYGTLMQVSPDLATVTTIGTFPVPAFVTTSLHGRDLWSGDYIVSFAGTIQLVAHDASATRTIGTHASALPPVIVQSHVDGDLRVASVWSTTNTWKRIDPRTTASTALLASSVGVFAASFESSNGRGVIEAVSGGTPTFAIATLSDDGRPIASRPINGPLAATPSVMARADGGALLARRVSTPNRWVLRLQAPTDVGRGYVIALSATGFSPGIPIGARTVPLVPDAIFALSIGNGLGALYTGGTGIVPATGVATATLDLRRFGSALSGARVWAAAAILDPNAPSGFTRITRPQVLILD